MAPQLAPETSDADLGQCSGELRIELILTCDDRRIRSRFFANFNLLVQTFLTLDSIDAFSPTPAPSPLSSLTGSQLLALYGQGTRRFGAVDLAGVNLFEAALLAIDLQGANLVEAYLPYADLSQGQLARSRGDRAQMSDITLYRANLRQVSWPGVNLCRANLRYACLVAADLRGADLSMADLFGADLRGANLGGANLGGANLRRSQLTNANLSQSNLFRAQSSYAELRKAYCDHTTIFPNGYRALLLDSGAASGSGEALEDDFGDALEGDLGRASQQGPEPGPGAVSVPELPPDESPDPLLADQPTQQPSDRHPDES